MLFSAILTSNITHRFASEIFSHNKNFMNFKIDRKSYRLCFFIQSWSEAENGIAILLKQEITMPIYAQTSVAVCFASTVFQPKQQSKRNCLFRGIIGSSPPHTARRFHRLCRIPRARSTYPCRKIKILYVNIHLIYSPAACLTLRNFCV